MKKAKADIKDMLLAALLRDEDDDDRTFCEVCGADFDFRDITNIHEDCGCCRKCCKCESESDSPESEASE